MDVGYCRTMARNPTRAEIGRLGEEIAASFLVERGYRIENRNLNLAGGEIDIVASGPEGHVAFEVKTTSDGADPTEAVDTRKLDALERAVASLPVPIRRLDVIAIRLEPDGAEIRWLRDVS